MYHVLGELTGGGIERWLQNVAEYPSAKYEHHFILLKKTVGDIEVDLIEKGHKVFHVDSKNPLKFGIFINRLRRIEKIDILHSHLHFYSGLVVMLAALIGIKKRISHSHLTDDGSNAFYKFVMRLLIWAFSSRGVAVSREAYSELFFKSSKNVVIHCGLRLDTIEKARVRRDDSIVIGTVARLERIKNQTVLIDILEELQRRGCVNSSLIVVGDGSRMSYLREYADAKGLLPYVEFSGWQGNVNAFLDQMDCFILPSLAEGLPLSAVEAQARGLPIIISQNITREVIIDPAAGVDIRLDAGIEAWADGVLNVIDRKVDIGLVAASDFNIDINIKELERLYDGL